jgi:hypothetical protein
MFTVHHPANPAVACKTRYVIYDMFPSVIISALLGIQPFGRGISNELALSYDQTPLEVQSSQGAIWGPTILT